MEELYKLTDGSIEEQSILLSDSFLDKESYTTYLLLVLQQAINDGYKDMKDTVISRFNKEEISESIFDILDSITENKKDFTNKELVFITLYESNKIRDVREIVTVQRLISILSLDRRHLITGYELYEIINGYTGDLPFSSEIKDYEDEKDHRYKLSLLLDKKGLLNSKLIYSDSYIKYHTQGNFNLNENEILHQVYYGDNERYPILIYMYLRELLPKEIDKTLMYEFFRYLDDHRSVYGLSEHYILTIYLDRSWDDKFGEVVGRYYYYLCQNNEMTLKYILSLLESSYDIDIESSSSSSIEYNSSKAEYNTNSVKYAIMYILKYELNRNIASMDVVEKLNKLWEKATGGNLLRGLIGIGLVGIIANYGNEKWIKWIIRKKYKDELLYSINKSNYKRILKVFDSEGYKTLDLLPKDYYPYHDSRMYMNIIVIDLNMKELIKIYKEKSGSNVFEQWFEEVILNQV